MMVLLRSRPVVDLSASLEVEPKVIVVREVREGHGRKCVTRGRAYNCVRVTVCLSYTGKNLPPSAGRILDLHLSVNDPHYLSIRNWLFLLLNISEKYKF